VYENALSGMAAHGREGYYFGENGEYKLYDVAKEVAKVLHELGKSETDEPKPLTEDDYKQPENEGVSSTCRCSRVRLCNKYMLFAVSSCTLERTRVAVHEGVGYWDGVRSTRRKIY